MDEIREERLTPQARPRASGRSFARRAVIILLLILLEIVGLFRTRIMG
jgi:hypothetical protein